MPDQLQPKLTVFISYVNEDSPICDALNNALQDAFGEQIAVFMDRVSIQQGDNIRDAIKANLAKADLLAVISTGTERPSHDWAGFELGFFSATHLQEMPDRPLWGRVVTFSAPGTEPRPQSLEKYIPLELDAELLNRTPAEFDRLLTIRDDDPLMLWFGQLLKAVSGDDLEQKAGIQAKYKRTIADFKRRVFAEYRRRPKVVLRPQKQLTIRYSTPVTVDGRFQGPATIAFQGGAASVFGIPDSGNNTMPWDRFAELVAPSRLGAFWTTTLARVLESARSAELMEMNRGLITSHSESRLFRLVLTSMYTYHDDSAEAQIYLIEVFRRDDYGDPLTTILLKGLQLVCRFRFLFLEPQSEFYYLNVQLAVDRKKVASIASRIASELDILASDTVESKLDQPGAYADFLGDTQIAETAAVWRPLRASLIASCAKAIAAEDEDSAMSARTALAGVLKDVCHQVRPYNHAMLTGLTTRLAQIAADED